jgi:hypothetical protein
MIKTLRLIYRGLSILFSKHEETTASFPDTLVALSAKRGI